MTWPKLAAVLVASWALVTCGLTMRFGWWLAPLSAGLLLGVYAYPYARKFYVDGLAEKDEADR